MSAPEYISCAECKHSYQRGDIEVNALLECKRFPPPGQPMSGTRAVLFVMRDDWCGEWSGKPGITSRFHP